MRRYWDIPTVGALAVLISLLAAVSPAAERTRAGGDRMADSSPSARAPQAAGKRAVDVLPAPLDKLACNITGLEESGHFELTSVSLSRSEDFGEEAVVWTVSVLQPISCRHATILLRRFSDVRFYSTRDDMHKELYSTDLLYSSRVSEGAVHGEILQRDDEFQIWVGLSLRHVDMLVFRNADTVVFHSPQTLRVGPVSAAARRWSAADSGIPRFFSKRQTVQRLPN